MRKTRRGKLRNKISKTRRRQKGGANVFNRLITRDEVLDEFAKTINIQPDRQINKYSVEALVERLVNKKALTPLVSVIFVIDNTNPKNEFNEELHNRATGIYYCASDLIKQKGSERTNKLLGSSNTNNKLFEWMKANVLDVIMGEEYANIKDVSFTTIPIQDVMR